MGEWKDAAPMSDEEIVGLYWRHDEKAISETDAKYGKYLLSVARRIVHDDSDSEECLNDTYIGAWNAIPPAKPASLQAFLTAIMRRRAIDCYKAKTREKRAASELTVSLSEMEELLTDGESAADAADTAALARLISGFVRALPDRRMYIFMSRWYMARPIREIAERLSCSESTIHKEIAAIRRDLKRTLEREGYSL